MTTRLMDGGVRSPEAAKRLGVRGRDVYMLLFAGELDGGPGREGIVYFDEASIDAYLERHGFGNVSNIVSNEPRRTEPDDAGRTDAGKTDGLSWSEHRCRLHILDEGHLYKNRRVDSAIEGMPNPGSQRGQDAKLWALRRTDGPRVVTFATATPVANSIAELWTTQSYLQPDTLAEVDLVPFDSWAATVGRTVTAWSRPRRRQVPHEDPLRPLPEPPGVADPLPPGGRRARRR